jgi:pseudouridine synthase
MRVQVFLSHNGVCSRREAMKVVMDGRVKVNGKVVTEPSTDVDPYNDQILVDGREVIEKQNTYIMLNKPAGYVTTKEDRHAERIIFELLPPKLQHLHPVGRLDKDTEGLLLLTNDGNLTHRLTHPKFHIDKTYFVRMLGQLKPEDKTQLEKGMDLNGEKTLPAKISQIQHQAKHTEFLMTIQEGRKRQIRLMLAACGYKVIYLRRLSHGPLKLGEMRKGSWRPLTQDELDELKKL